MEYQKKGIAQPFKSIPKEFSEKLLEGRVKQFLQANHYNDSLFFYDRGVQDIIGYMYFANKKIDNPFTNTSKLYHYDQVFILPPWEKIHITDDQRHENFEEAVAIFKNINKAYIDYGHTPIEVPFGTTQERVNFILKHKIN